MTTSQEPTVPIATTGGRGRSRRRVARLPALLAVPLVLAGVFAVERFGPDDGAAGDDVASSQSAAQRSLMPVASPPGSLSSTWFCAAGTGTGDGIADHTVVIANPTADPVTATVTVFAGTIDTDPNAAHVAQQPPVARSVEVAANARASLRLADVVGAPFVSAMVEAPGGDLVVEHQVSGDRGADTGPCASAASPSWHFASGSTNREAQQLLVLFNPFPDDAVVDITFATTEGFRAPQPYNGFIVPGGRVVALDVSAVVARHDDVSASVIARRGRLVADRIQVYGGFRGSGLAVGLGQPQLAQLLFFPSGGSADGLTERFLVYNPGRQPAQLDIEIYLDNPEVNGEVEPVAVTVQPQSFFAVELSGEARVPSGVAHSAIVRVHNGIPVAVERESFGDDPSPRRGVAITPGSPLLADTWVLAAGEASGAIGETVTLFNPTLDEGISRVRVVPLDGSGQEVPSLAELEVPPGGRLTVNLADHLNSETLALRVEGTQPIVVERSLTRLGGRGMSQSLGVPLVRTIVRPPPIEG
ncbi:MAG: DUF5719 family protein [Acidimicrobiales bacterium]